MPREKPLIHMIMEPELIDKIDDFRFEHRFASRAAAMKWLIKYALEQEPKPASGGV